MTKRNRHTQEEQIPTTLLHHIKKRELLKQNWPPFLLKVATLKLTSPIATMTAPYARDKQT